MEIAILNSRIYTGDPAAPWAEALCVKNGRIAAVGGNADVKATCGKGARLVVWPGSTVAGVPTGTS